MPGLPLLDTLRGIAALGWLAVVVCLCAVPQTAWAQEIQPIQSTAVSRAHEAENRPAGDAFFYISREDCLASDVLTFDLDIVGPDASKTFQVWAGDDDDCREETNRSGIEARCWLVYEGTLDSPSELVRIPVQDIAARQLPQSTTGVSTGSLESCANDIELGITLYFMHVSGGATSGNVVQWNTKLDLKGPAAPTEVKAGIGDERLIVEWSTTAGTRSGYKIFCEASSSDLSSLSGRFAQLKAAQTTGDAGADASSGGSGGGAAITPVPSTTITPSSNGDTPAETSSGGTGSGGFAECATSLREGELPPADAIVCGEVEVGSSERGTAANLENSVVYAVAVAAVDELGNPGPLSNIDCEAPEDLDEFFETYRRMGGKGGGGFCALAPSGFASPWFALLVAAGSLGLVLRRASR